MSIQTRPNRDRTFPDYGFPSGGFFGTPTFSHFSQPAWESRKVEHKQRGNDGGRYLTHPLGTISYEAAWNYRIINSETNRLLSPRSTHRCQANPGDRVRSQCTAPKGFSQTIPEQKSLSLADSTGAKHAQE